MLLILLVYMASTRLDKAVVMIDEAYLSRISKYFGNGTYIPIDYRRFANSLAKEALMWCSQVVLYLAPPYQSPKSTPEEAARKSSHDKFVYALRQRGILVREGRCQKTANGFRQKGVDSLIIKDMCRLPRDIRNIILITADTDFAPVIEELQQDMIDVTLFYYSDFIRNSNFAMSNHLANVCRNNFLLRKDHFENNPRMISADDLDKSLKIKK